MKIIKKDWRDPFLRYIYVKILYDLPVKNRVSLKSILWKKFPRDPLFSFKNWKLDNICYIHAKFHKNCNSGKFLVLTGICLWYNSIEFRPKVTVEIGGYFINVDVVTFNQIRSISNVVTIYLQHLTKVVEIGKSKMALAWTQQQLIRKNFRIQRRCWPRYSM